MRIQAIQPCTQDSTKESATGTRELVRQPQVTHQDMASHWRAISMFGAAGLCDTAIYESLLPQQGRIPLAYRPMEMGSSL